jgi:hypothetical protein
LLLELEVELFSELLLIVVLLIIATDQMV